MLAAVAETQSYGRFEGPVEWETSTTQRAAALNGIGPGTADVPIYLVHLRGRFELPTAPRPPGATLLDDAARLDGLPVMRILMTDLKRIAEAAGCDPEKLAEAALALYPGQDGTGVSTPAEN